MNTIKIKVGSLVLTAARDEALPQEFAAWHQTVRVPPGTYDVFAYLEGEGPGRYRVCQLSAACEGITISSNFRAHLFGQWGKSDNNCDGEPAVAHVHLPTFGMVGDPSPLLAQASLCDALVREEWDPGEDAPQSLQGRRMWRFGWDRGQPPIIIESPRHGGGGTNLGALVDPRRYCVDGVELLPAELARLDLSLDGVRVNQLRAGETVGATSWQDGRRCQVTRLA